MSNSEAEALGTPDLGRALAVLRLAAGMTQEQVAIAAGLPSSSVSDYERGRKAPTVRNLQAVLRAMGCSLASLELARRFLVLLRSEEPLGPEALAPRAAAGADGLDGLAKEIALILARLVQVVAETRSGALPGRDGTPSSADGGATSGEVETPSRGVAAS